MMKKRLMVLAFAGVLAVGLSSCGKKEVSSNHVQSVTSETGAETSISEGETPDLSEEQPEQVELPESEEVQGDISQNTEDTQTQEPEQEATQDNSSQEPAQSAPVSYADRQEIYLDGSWQYADHSAIHSGAAVKQVETEKKSLLVSMQDMELPVEAVPKLYATRMAQPKQPVEVPQLVQRKQRQFPAA